MTRIHSQISARCAYIDSVRQTETLKKTLRRSGLLSRHAPLNRRGAITSSSVRDAMYKSHWTSASAHKPLAPELVYVSREHDPIQHAPIRIDDPNPRDIEYLREPCASGRERACERPEAPRHGK